MERGQRGQSGHPYVEVSGGMVGVAGCLQRSVVSSVPMVDGCSTMVNFEDVSIAVVNVEWLWTSSGSLSMVSGGGRLRGSCQW